MKKIGSILIITSLVLLCCREKKKEPVLANTANTTDTTRIAYLQKDTATHSGTIDKSLYYQVVGGPPMPYELEGQAKVAELHGFIFQYYGCVIDNDSVIPNADKNNQRLFEILQRQYPGYTEEKMNEEVMFYGKIHKSLDSTVSKIIFIKQVAKKQEDDYTCIRWKTIDPAKEIFDVDVYYVQALHRSPDSLLHHLRVTLPTGKVLMKTANGNWKESTK